MRKLSVVGILLCVLFSSVSIAAKLDPPKTPKKKVVKTDASITGHVTCKKEHIPFITVNLKGTSIGVATDATGHYMMNNLPVGEHTLVVKGVGFKTLEQKVNVQAGKTQEVLLDIEEDVIGLEQVVVTADRNEKNRKEATTIVNTISPKLFERLQSTTLSEGLNFTPGLRMENNCQNCGFTQVRMNGLEGPYSQILINSRPIFSGLAGVYGLELIPATMIERVEVVRGGGSAIYGSNAIAGTINLITKDPIKNSYKVDVNTSLVGVGVDGAGDAAADNNISVNASIVSDDFRSGLSVFGFKRSKDAFDANDDSFSEISEMENTTIGLRSYYKTGNRSKLTVDYFNINEERRGGDKFDYPVHEAGIAEAVDHKINTGAIAWDAFTGDHNKFSVYLSGQHIDRGTYYGAEQDLSAYGNTKDFAYSTGIQYVHDFEKVKFAHMHLTLGVENNGENLKDKKLGYYDKETKKNEPNTIVADQKSNIFGFYAQHEMKFEKTTVSVGFRLDNYDIKDDAPDHASEGGNSGTVFSPRVTLLQNIAPWIQARASYSKGYRAPQIFDEDLHIETSQARKVIHKNDPDLKQEDSHSWSTSLDFTPKIGNVQTQFLIEGFYTKLNNPFYTDYGDGADENGLVTAVRRNVTGAHVSGINLEFNAAPSRKFQVNAGFTIQESRYEEAQDFDEKSFLRTPDNYGFFSLTWSPTWQLSLSASGTYTGKMLVPYYGNTISNPDDGVLRKSDSFFETGLKASYDIELSRGVIMQLNGGVKNLFNSYQDDFDRGGSRDPGYIYGPNQPRTIFFGISFRNLL
ncbi:TonB-dependent receptor [Prolixibacteraceae bacterium JC049]|nr:TonB-dependent receptor [Prolixibacteraceae bacterium JC049]